MTLDRLRGPAVTLASLVVGALIWQWYGSSVPKTEFVGFWATISALWHLAVNGTLWHALGESMEVFGIGLAIAVVIGFFGGLLLARVPALRVALEPYVAAAYALPAVALIPFELALVGFAIKAKVIVVVLFGIWPVLINTLEGARSVNADLLEVATSYRTREPQLWRHVIIPYTIPYAMTGVRQSIARCLVGMIAAEFLLSSSGLGNLIILNTQQFKTANVLAGVLTILIVATILMGIGRAIENHFARWRAGA